MACVPRDMGRVAAARQPHISRGSYSPYAIEDERHTGERRGGQWAGGEGLSGRRKEKAWGFLGGAVAKLDGPCVQEASIFTRVPIWTFFMACRCSWWRVGGVWRSDRFWV